MIRWQDHISQNVLQDLARSFGTWTVNALPPGYHMALQNFVNSGSSNDLFLMASQWTDLKLRHQESSSCNGH